MLHRLIFLIALAISFYSQTQTLAWVKQFSPLSTDINISCFDSYPNSAHVICGDYRSSIDFDFGAGQQLEYNSSVNPMPFILKVDFDGNFLWYKTLNAGTITEVRIDNNGDILLGLRHSSSSLDIDPGPGVVNVSNGGGGYRHILIKLSSTGDYLWHKQMPVNGSGYMEFEVNTANDIIVAGDFSSSIYWASQSISCWGIYNSFLLEVGESGSENWIKRIGGTSLSSLSSSKVEALDIDASGNIYLAGVIEGSIDFNQSGSTGGLSSGSDYAYFLAKYNDQGSYQFVQNHGYTDNGHIHELVVNAAGEAHITSAHNPINPPNEYGFTVRKCNTTGSVNWEKTYLSQDVNTYAESIACDESGNTYVSGKFSEDSLDMDPGSGEDFMIRENGSENGFVIKYGPNGNYLWSYHLNHDSLYAQTGISTNFNQLKMIENNSLFVSNGFYGSTFFKLAVNGSLQTDELKPNAKVNIYPNPGNGLFTVEFPEHQVKTSVRIVSMTGELLKEVEFTGTTMEIRLDLEKGSYLMHSGNLIRLIIIQ